MLAGFLLMRAVLLVALVVGAVLYVVTLPFKVAFDLLWRAVDAIYPRLLRFALAAPLIIIAATSGLGWVAYDRSKDLGLELIPEVHQGEFTAFLSLQVGTPSRTPRPSTRISPRRSGDSTASRSPPSPWAWRPTP